MWKDCGCGCKGSVAKKKFLISILAASIFFIVMYPGTFKVTRSVLGNWVASPSGCPTLYGYLFHLMVFALSSLLTMGKFSLGKLKISLFSAIIVYLVSNANTYKFTRSVLGPWVASATGCPTTQGVTFHAGVLVLIMYLVMNSRTIATKFSLKP